MQCASVQVTGFDGTRGVFRVTRIARRVDVSRTMLGHARHGFDYASALAGVDFGARFARAGLAIFVA